MFKLATFSVEGKQRPGIIVKGLAGDLNEAARVLKGRWSPGPGNPRLVENDLLSILSNWNEWHPALENLAEIISSFQVTTKDSHFLWTEDAVKLEAPLPRPPRLFMAGANYYDHILEMTGKRPVKADLQPFFFLKNPFAVIGQGDFIRKSSIIKKLDWECEFAVVIGKRARRVKASNWLEYVAGYTILNDISARDHGIRTDMPFGMDFLAHKSQDTYAPMGPYIIPKEFIENPMNLKIKCSVNGKLHQNSNTSELIFTPDEMIEYLSALMTLEPGDIISTGSPAGVGAGKNLYLQNGDKVAADIEKIGILENTIVEEEL